LPRVLAQHEIVKRFVLFSTLATMLAVAIRPCAAEASEGSTALHTFAGPAGGHIVLGEVEGAASTEAVLRRGIGRLHGTFDHLTLTSSVASPASNVVYVSFEAIKSRRSSRGVVIANHMPKGASGFAVLYDDADRFTRTSPALAQQLQKIINPSAASTGAPSDSLPAMHQVAANDGTLTAQIPTTWHVQQMAMGSLVAGAPTTGEYVVVNENFKLIDPRSQSYQIEQSNDARIGIPAGRSLYGLPLHYPSSPAQTMVAIFRGLAGPQAGDQHIRVLQSSSSAGPGGTTQGHVVLRSVAGGVSLISVNDVILFPPATSVGNWMATVIAMQAPESTFQRETATMLAIVKGYRANNAAIQDRVRQNIAANEAMGDRARQMQDQATQSILAGNRQQMNQNEAQFHASMQNAADVQDGIDRSTSGFIHYLNGTTVVENPSTGVRGTVDAEAAQAAAAHDPAHFRVVPLSQYQKGVDF
jgi:hypothetical protein